MSDDTVPPKQLESDRGGSGRSRKTAIGSGGTGGFGGSGGSQSHPYGTDDSGMGHKPRAVICDRSLTVRVGLSIILRAHVDVVDHTDDANTLIDIINAHKPHIVITDIDFENDDPLKHFRFAFKFNRASDFIVLSDSFNATRYFRRLLNLGIRFICLKQSLLDSLVNAVRTPRHSEGNSYFDPSLIALIEQLELKSALCDHKISNTEFAVLQRLGLRNSEIGSELGIKTKQVERCIEALLAKLKVPTRTTAMLKVVQMGGTILPKMPERDPESGQNLELIRFEHLCREAIES